MEKAPRFLEGLLVNFELEVEEVQASNAWAELCE